MTALPPLVAIVDDDPSVRRALASVLRATGYRVHQFDGAREFFEKGPEIWPDCIITDVQMPGISGLELLERVAGRSVPVLVITAFPDPAIRQRALGLGARAFYSKPFDVGRIITEIEKALAEGDEPVPRGPGEG